jgi:hypothetical protein
MQCLCREGADDTHYAEQSYRHKYSLGSRPFELLVTIVFNDL